MLITYIKTAALCLFVEMKAFEYVKSATDVLNIFKDWEAITCEISISVKKGGSVHDHF